MVFGQILGELESGEFVTCSNTPNDPGTLEINEVGYAELLGTSGSFAAMSEMLTG